MTHFEKIKNLMQEIHDTEPDPDDAKELIGFCKDTTLNMTGYVQQIVNSAILIPNYRFTKSEEDLISSIERLDRQRRDSHNVACASVAQMNRLSRKYLGEPVFEIDESKYSLDRRGDYPREFRTPVANWALELVDEMFYDGRNLQLEEMRDIEKKELDFSDSVSKEYDIDER